MTSTEQNISTTPAAAPETTAALAAPAKVAAKPTAKAPAPKAASTSAAKPAKKVAAKPVAKAAAKVTAKPVAKASAPVAAKPVTKAAAKPASKPAKPVAKTVAKAAAKPAVKVAAPKVEKAKKPKMVRDSFTFPKNEYDVLDLLKLRAAKLGTPIKKTELIRAGVKAIAALGDAAFKAALAAVPSLKTGRPAKGKKA
jgi:hypothetical protein